MAISDRIKAEASRTIDNMQRFYAKYSDETDEAEELEHRIARIEASMEGCNGLTQDEKIQKTAENVFELTCAQERSYDSLRREIKITRDEYKKECREIKSALTKGISDLAKKIEESGMDSSSNVAKKPYKPHSMSKIIADNPLLAFNAFIFLLILVFVSGHFEILSKLWPWAGAAAKAAGGAG